MDGRDRFLGTATVATSAAVLKLITGGNLFSPAVPSAYITFSLSGTWIIELEGLKEKQQGEVLMQVWGHQQNVLQTARWLAKAESCVQETQHSKKKAGAGGFVLCANGADAGVVLFI